jgi:hypothetical protein
MTNLPKCSVESCASLVSKAGFKLCLEHWRIENKKPKNEFEKVEAEKLTATVVLNSTQLGEYLDIDAKKVNQVLAELGWIEKGKKGWLPTVQGKKLRAEAHEYHKTGIPFVLWPDSILKSRILTNAVSEFLGGQEQQPKVLAETVPTKKEEKTVGFRDKFVANHRATDGHMVRSRGEMLIDNFLYFAGIAHAYERLLPVEEELYCDFYVPAGKVYIEYWGLDDDPKYIERKNIKKEIYKKSGFNLIELNNAQVDNLDDYLPKLLLKYGVVVD